MISSLHYYKYHYQLIRESIREEINLDRAYNVLSLTNYLFGLREQLRFGNYITDSRTQALGYGGNQVLMLSRSSTLVSVTEVSPRNSFSSVSVVLLPISTTVQRIISLLCSMSLPADFHYPKFIAHSEFAINGEEISNTTSDNQGNIVTNLKSGEDGTEFNIDISVSSILIGVSYISIPEIYTQIKERHYFHADRYDMFQPMLQYFGDQAIWNKEISDSLPNPGDAYGYTSRNGEYKQRLSQASGAF